MAVLRKALGLYDEIARLRMCAHRDVERHVARMARETLHQSSEGCHRVENEIGRLCLAHKDATLRVVGRVAHVDENRLKTGYVAKVGHLSTPNSCPRIAFEMGKPWRYTVKTKLVSPRRNGRFTRKFACAQRSSAWF